MMADCCGAGLFVVSPSTTYHSEKEAIAALLHSHKCQLLCQLRSEPVHPDNVLPGRHGWTKREWLKFDSAFNLEAASGGQASTCSR